MKLFIIQYNEFDLSINIENDENLEAERQGKQVSEVKHENVILFSSQIVSSLKVLGVSPVTNIDSNQGNCSC